MPIDDNKINQFKTKATEMGFNPQMIDKFIEFKKSKYQEAQPQQAAVTVYTSPTESYEAQPDEQYNLYNYQTPQTETAQPQQGAVPQMQQPQVQQPKMQPQEISFGTEEAGASAQIQEQDDSGLEEFFKQWEQQLQVPQEPQEEASIPEQIPQQQPEQAKKVIINQQFGNPNPGLYGPGGWNQGVDIAATPNEPQSAPPEGNWVVEEAYDQGGWNQGWGNSVIIRNEDTGESIRRSHFNKVYVDEGDEVTGQILGTTGRTGRTTGWHKDIEYMLPNGQLSDYTKSPYFQYEF